MEHAQPTTHKLMRSDAKKERPPDFSKLFHRVENGVTGIDLSFDAFESVALYYQRS